MARGALNTASQHNRIARYPIMRESHLSTTPARTRRQCVTEKSLPTLGHFPLESPSTRRPAELSPHVAIYLRVSSKSQDVASQEQDLKRWAATRTEPIEWYRDSFTGKVMDRPGFNRLERQIAAGNVSTLTVWRLDRLGRTAKGLTALFDDLFQRKVNLISLRDGLDLSTPAGRLMANVLASVAAYETEVRSERQMAGITAAKAKGVKFGRPPGTKRSRIPEAKRTAIFDHKAAGWKISDIARAVGLARKTVYSVLADRVESSSA